MPVGLSLLLVLFFLLMNAFFVLSVFQKFDYLSTWKTIDLSAVSIVHRAPIGRVIIGKL